MCCGLCKKLEAYFKKHAHYNAVAHLLVGAGIGILITYPCVRTHPLRWGGGLLLVGVLLHLYPLVGKK